MLTSRFVRVYLMPGAVFQSVMIGGGYGTGRELVEFFTRFGIIGGLLGMAVTVLCIALVLGATYEFARCFKVYDYRSFFNRLLGPGWPAFEILYVLLFLLVLAVVASAAGHILEVSFGIPYAAGVAIMLGAVTTLNFYGRELVAKCLTLWSVVLYAVFILYFVIAMERGGDTILWEMARTEILPGWLLNGFKYALYNVAIGPAILFAARDIETRRQAVLSGLVSAFVSIIPGLLFHITFAAGYPSVLDQQIPTYWMIGRLAVPFLLPLYIIVLFGTFIETGAGFIQGLNERLDAWAFQTRGQALSRPVHATVAIAAILLSAGLATLGIVRLIAEGYGTIAWGFLFIYIAPVLTVGVYKLRRKNAKRLDPSGENHES